MTATPSWTRCCSPVQAARASCHLKHLGFLQYCLTYQALCSPTWFCLQMESYFSQSTEAKLRDSRPELHYQVQPICAHSCTYTVCAESRLAPVKLCMRKPLHRQLHAQTLALL